MMGGGGGHSTNLAQKKTHKKNRILPISKESEEKRKLSSLRDKKLQ